MKPTVVKRAVLKNPQGLNLDRLLMRRGKGEFVWDGQELAGTVYLSEEDAIRAIRVEIETNPTYVGWDLTVYSVEPSAAERAAKRIVLFGIPNAEGVAAIIQDETNLPALLDATQTLLAYIFRNRAAYSRALFPQTADGAPRDVTLDGLLLEAIEALEKSTGQNFENLKGILKQPPSKIIGVRPKAGGQAQ